MRRVVDDQQRESVRSKEAWRERQAAISAQLKRLHHEDQRRSPRKANGLPRKSFGSGPPPASPRTGSPSTPGTRLAGSHYRLSSSDSVRSDLACEGLHGSVGEGFLSVYREAAVDYRRSVSEAVLAIDDAKDAGVQRWRNQLRIEAEALHAELSRELELHAERLAAELSRTAEAHLARIEGAESARCPAEAAEGRRDAGASQPCRRRPERGRVIAGVVASVGIGALLVLGLRSFDRGRWPAAALWLGLSRPAAARAALA